jgi:hypothetical protein
LNIEDSIFDIDASLLLPTSYLGKSGARRQNHLQQLSIQPNGIEHFFVPCEALRSLSGPGGGAPQASRLIYEVLP